MKKALLVALLATLMLSFFSCSEPTKEASGENAVIISKSSLKFSEPGETYTFDFFVIKNGTVVPELANEVVWTSSDSAVAVCEGNVITSTGYGSCVVRAAYGDEYAICIVQATNPKSILTVSHSDVTLDNIGAEKRISAFSETGDEISSSVEWITSNKNIAYCERGKIIAVGYGSCTITARSKTQSAVCTVTVENPTAPKLSLSENMLSLGIGKTHTLTAASNNNAGDILEWKSTDPSVATCKDGVVTARRTGTCVIIAVTEKGYSATSVVTVGNPKKNINYSEYFNFDFRNIGRELRYINKSTGAIETTALIYDYDMETQLLGDGRLVMHIYLLGVKTYDEGGINGTLPTAVTASIYREDDVFCDKRQYRTDALKVGETFRIKCSGFTIQTNNDGTPRELYMTFSKITEHYTISR